MTLSEIHIDLSVTEYPISFSLTETEISFVEENEEVFLTLAEILQDFEIIEERIWLTESVSQISFDFGNVIDRVVIESDVEIEEELVGTINNVNTIFTTSQDYREGTTKLFWNGIKMIPLFDFSEAGGNVILLCEPPSNITFTDKLTINYRTI